MSDRFDLSEQPGNRHRLVFAPSLGQSPAADEINVNTKTNTKTLQTDACVADLVLLMV